jgi:hypothetical protein
MSGWPASGSRRRAIRYRPHRGRGRQTVASSSVSESRGGSRRPATSTRVSPVSWADGGPVVTGVVRCGPVVRGPDVARMWPSGHELGRHVRGRGRQPRYVINHSKGRLPHQCGWRRLPRGFSGSLKGGWTCRSGQRLTAGAGVEDATGWQQRGRAAWLAPCSGGVPVLSGIRCDRTRPAFGGDRTTNGGANA